jgi:hypothetical protein
VEQEQSNQVTYLRLRVQQGDGGVDTKLARFSNLIFKIKFIVFETVLLGCFLYVLYLVVKHEFGF